jgi:hypothetical protein
MTIVDRLNVAHDASNAAVWKHVLDGGFKTDVCWTIDAARFKALMVGSLK